MSQRFPPEVHAFIRENVVGRSAAELAEMTNAAFGTTFTKETMGCYKKNHKLRSGPPDTRIHKTGPNGRKGLPTKLYPRDIMDFIFDNYQGVGPTDMAERLNERFGTSYTPGQIKGFYGSHKLNSGITGRFEKGHESHNKGKKGLKYPGSEKGWFQDGHDPYNTAPVGTILVKSDGYLWKKIDNKPKNKIKNWRQLHLIVWEEANGPIPDGHFIIFKDGNKQNVALSNLMMISRAENAVMNKFGLRFRTPEHTEAGVLIARIKSTAYRRKKELKK